MAMSDYEMKNKPSRANGNADFLSQYPNEGPGVLEEEEEIVITHYTATQVAIESVKNLNVVIEVRVAATEATNVNRNIENDVAPTVTVPQYSIEELTKLQDDDGDFCEVMKIINDKVRMNRVRRLDLPVQTKKLLRQIQRLEIINHELYRRIKNPSGVDRYQCLVPDALKMRILDPVPSVGHQGRDRMLQILKIRCFWVGVMAEVGKYCRKCKKCNVTNSHMLRFRVS